MYFHRVKLIDHRGCHYQEGDIVITGKCESMPVFGKIMEILYFCEEDVCFFSVCQTLSEFWPHYHAYTVQFTPHTVITTVDSLLDPHPLNTHVCMDTTNSHHTFVTLKFTVL